MADTLHYDMADLGPPDLSREGFLTVDAFVSKVGPLRYFRDGKELWQYVSAENLFDPDSMKTAALKPVTEGHPRGPRGDLMWLDTTNAAKFAKGSSGEVVERVGDKLRVRLSITDAGLIEKVKSGKLKQISAGYYSIDTPVDMEVDGKKISFLQTGRKYNHFAILEDGRAGAEVGLRSDEAERPPTKQERNVSHVKVTIKGQEVAGFKYDGMDMDVPVELSPFIGRLVATIDGLASKLSDVQTSATQYKAKADEAESKIEEMKKSAVPALTPAQIRQAGVARLRLETVAANLGLKADGIDKMDDVELKAAIVKHKSPSAVFDTKTEQGRMYLDARVDIMMDELKESDKGAAQLAALANATPASAGAKADGAELPPRERFLTAQAKHKPSGISTK